MSDDAMLGWIRSFDGVDETNCPTMKSLRDGFVFANIFNQIQDEKIEFVLKPLNPDKDDWITALRNLRGISEKIKPAFDAAKVQLKLDASSIAKATSDTAIIDLIRSFVLLALKGPKKAEMVQKVKSCSKEVQVAVKEIVSELKKKDAAPAAKPAAAVAKPVSSPASKIATLLEECIKKLTDEEQQLQKEKEELLKVKAELVENQKVSKSPELIAYEKNLAEYSSLEEEFRQLEELVAAKEKQNADEKVDERRKEARQEEVAVKKNIQELKKKLDDMIPTLERFRMSADPKAQAYLQEIADAEKSISQTYRDKVMAEINQENRRVEELKIEVHGLEEKVGESDSDSNTDGEQLNKDITDLVMNTRELEEEIKKINSKTEAIKAMKQQKSFLEHLRSSSQFIRPQ